MDIVDVIHVADGVEWSGRRLGWCCWKLRRQRQTCQKKTDATIRLAAAGSTACLSRLTPK